MPGMMKLSTIPNPAILSRWPTNQNKKSPYEESEKRLKTKSSKTFRVSRETVWERLSKSKKQPKCSESYATEQIGRLHKPNAYQLKQTSSMPVAGKECKKPNKLESKSVKKVEEALVPEPMQKPKSSSYHRVSSEFLNVQPNASSTTTSPSNSAKQPVTVRRVSSTKLRNSNKRTEVEQKADSAATKKELAGKAEKQHDNGDVSMKSSKESLIKKRSKEEPSYMSMHFQSDQQHALKNCDSMESMEEYHMAPLMPTPSRTSSVASSVKIQQEFESLLRKKKRCMEPEDIKVVKDIVRTDSRGRKFKNPDEGLFRDILKSQLKEISKQGHVIKSALSNLADSSELDDVDNISIASSTPTVILKSHKKVKHVSKKSKSPKECKILEAKDSATTFCSALTKLPTARSLEQEYKKKQLKVQNETPQVNEQIREELALLRSLNDTLKTSLEANNKQTKDATEGKTDKSQRKPNKHSNSKKKSKKAEPKSIGTIRELQVVKVAQYCEVLPAPQKFNIKCIVCCMSTLEAVELKYYSVIEHKHAAIVVHVLGLRREIARIQEFRIAQKSIVELRQEERRHFFVPISSETLEMKRTSFKRLQQNPDVLLRLIKPKNNASAFNVLEQDPIFMNNYLFNLSNNCSNFDGIETPDGSECDQKSAIAPFSSQRLESIFSENHKRLYQMPPKAAPAAINATASKNAAKERASERNRSMAAHSSSIQKRLESAIKEESATREPARKTKLEKKQSSSSSCNTDAVTDKKLKHHRAAIIKESLQGIVNQARSRRMRRAVGPLPMNKYVDPKNSLIKTILVGTVQISVFLLLIMAITYPDAKC